MRDFRTTTEADAGRHARAYGTECDADRPTRGEAEADEYALGYEAPRSAPRPTLVEDVNAALAWAGAANYNREVRETRRGVVAFQSREDDDLPAIVTEFSHRGLQAHPDGEVVWVRRGPVVPRPDPWAKP